MVLLNHSNLPADFRPRFRIAATVCASSVLATAITVLVGWTLHIERLKRVVPNMVEMNPLTAVSFILCGSAVFQLLGQPISRRSHMAVITLCVPVVLLGISQLFAIIPRFDLHWDQWMFRASLHGNRVAPNTAACLVLFPLAIICIDVEWPRRVRLAQMLVLPAGAIAAVALLGYLYQTQSLYNMPGFPMALHSGFCAGALCLAVLFARPRSGIMAVITGDDMGGMLARRLMAVTFVAPALLGWLRLVAVRHQLISPPLSNAVLVICITSLFGALVWSNARMLRRTDADRRRAQDTMRQAEQRYRAVVEQTAEGIYLLDAATKRVMESNIAFQQLLGYTAAEVSQLTAYDIVDRPRENIDQRITATLAEGHAIMGERQYRRRDGSRVDVQANASVIEIAGKSVICTVVHDITRRKIAEREIEFKNQQLEEIAQSERSALMELKRTQSQLVQTEKLAGLGQMVAGVAHEINNPLSFVGNNVAVLQRDVAAIRRVLQMYQQADAILEAGNKPLMEEIREFAGRIDLPYTLSNSDDLMARSREGLRRIQQIVKDLREFARLDESDLHEVDLNEGIASTANIIKGTARRNQVEIELDLHPLPAFACYPAKVNQVVMNLLSNAIDASENNTKVIVRSRPAHNGGVEIQVQDHGSGIKPEALPRIFDPFYTTKPPGQGTGLGLSISYGIIQDHGGSIDVQSELGKGTCFTIRLPRRK